MHIHGTRSSKHGVISENSQLTFHNVHW